MHAKEPPLRSIPARPETARALVKALIAVVVWGASFVAVKIALRDVSPLTVIWVRFAIGLLMVGGLMSMRRERVTVPGPALARFALLGFLGIAFHQWLQVTGLETAQASTSAWIVTTTPVFIAMLGRMVLRERLGLRRSLGIAVAILGVIVVVAKGDWHAFVHGQTFLWGDFLILVSAPNWAVFTILSRRVLQKHSAVVTMFYAMLSGWLIVTVGFISGGGIAELGRLSLAGTGAIVFLGVFCTGLAYIFWYDALKVMPAARLGSLLYVEPLVTVFVAALLLGEGILISLILGGLLILTGVWIVNRRISA